MHTIIDLNPFLSGTLIHAQHQRTSIVRNRLMRVNAFGVAVGRTFGGFRIDACRCAPPFAIGPDVLIIIACE